MSADLINRVQQARLLVERRKSEEAQILARKGALTENIVAFKAQLAAEGVVAADLPTMIEAKRAEVLSKLNEIDILLHGPQPDQGAEAA